MRIIIHFYIARSIEISLLFNPTATSLAFDLYRLKKNCMCVRDPKLLPPHFDNVKNENNTATTPPQ